MDSDDGDANTNTKFSETKLDVGIAQSCCDHLDVVTAKRDFPIINDLDLRHRARIAEDIVRQDLSAADRSGLDELALSRRKWYFLPAAALPHDGNRETTATLQMGILRLMASRPFGFLEGNGEVVRRVMVQDGAEDLLTTVGRRAFGAHIDHAWGFFPWERDDGKGRPRMPDFLSLAGHTNPNNIATYFADPLDVYFKLSELSQYVLSQPEYSFPSPPSVDPPGFATRLPIIVRGPDGLPVIRLSPRLICESERAKKALAELDTVLQHDSIWNKVVLTKGDIVVARGTALHKRGEVNGPRELIAIYGRHQLTESRVLSTANPHLELVR